MFSKPIFKQCLRGNWQLWLVFTVASCALAGVVISMYDPSEFSQLASAAAGSSLSGVFSGMSTFMGTTQQVFTMFVVLTVMVYVIITANGLVVDEVDSGSLAYTLSAPVRRSTVVLTKLSYLLTSIVAMFLVIGGCTLGVAQVTQHCVLDNGVTEDVKAASKALDRSESYVSQHLYTILDDKNALQDGATSRDMDTEAYTIYLKDRMEDDAYKAAAKQLTSDRADQYKNDKDMDRDDIEITRDELKAKPQLMLGDNDALKAGAERMGMSAADYRNHVQSVVDAKEKKSDNDQSKQRSTFAASASDARVITDPATAMMAAKSAAAKALDVSESDIEGNMPLMKTDTALKAEEAATSLDRAALVDMINQSMVSTASASDNAIDFDMETFAWMWFGCLLLILAFGGIGFFASCVFNRSGTAMALGGGLPFLFYLISLVIQMVGSKVDALKYFTLTSLYDAQSMIDGTLSDFVPGLCVLGGIAVALYAAGCAIFCKKDLPL